MTENRLIHLARSGKRLTPILLVAVLSLLFFLVPVIVGSIIGEEVIVPLFGTEDTINASAVTKGLVFTLIELLVYVTSYRNRLALA